MISLFWKAKKDELPSIADMTTKNLNPNGGAAPDGGGGGHDGAPQMRSSRSCHTQAPHKTSLLRSPKRIGVRRRREESVEIEELDSETMRQNSYNYFQRHARTTTATPPAHSNSSSTASSSSDPAFAFTGLRHSGGSFSRKRQRTLADRLEELCLGGPDYLHPRSSSSSGGVNVEMMGDDDDEIYEEDTEEEDRAASRGELLVYGGVPNMKGFFFDSSRRKTMDRVFRHYAAVANHAVASTGEASGNELVLFRRAYPSPPPFVVNVPYFSLSPQELEALSRQEKNKRMRSSQSRGGGDRNEDDDEVGRADAGTARAGPGGAYRTRSRSGSTSASSTSSPPFQALGVPHTDSVEDMEDVDMDGPKGPHPSGEISHSEWFLDDEL